MPLSDGFEAVINILNFCLVLIQKVMKFAIHNFAWQPDEHF